MKKEKRFKLHDLIWDCKGLSELEAWGGMTRQCTPRLLVWVLLRVETLCSLTFKHRKQGKRPSRLACVFMLCVVCELDIKKIPVPSKIM